MARHAHEFQCDGQGAATPNNPTPDNCGWYNYPPLDDKMNGNYTIICGNCGHHHYRVIRNGVVTSDRHSDELGEAHIIHVLKSQTQPTRRQLGAIAQIRQMESAGRMS